LFLYRTTLVLPLRFGDKATSVPGYVHIIREILILGAIFGGLIAVEKWIVEVLAVSFHRTALAKGIKMSNEQFRVLTALYKATSYRPPLAPVGRRLVPHISKRTHTESPEGHLARDKFADLTSKSRAKEIANSIFSNLCPSNRDFLIRGDFRVVFSRDQ